GFGRNAGAGNGFVTGHRSTWRIIRYGVEEENEPGGGGFRTRSQDRTARSTHRQKQPLLLRRPDGCGSGENNARGKGRRSFCINPRKILGRNDKYGSDCTEEKYGETPGISKTPRLTATIGCSIPLLHQE